MARSSRSSPAPVLAGPPPAPSVRSALTAALGLGLGILLVYVRTLAPDVVAGDGADLQTAAGLPGIAHPPGYPLFTMLGWLFSRFSDSPAWSVNLLTAVCGAMAAGVLTWLVADLTGLWAAGLVAGACLGLAPLCWQHAVAAEVFTLNNLLAAVLLALGLRLSRRPDAATLVGLAGVLGLSLSHHHTVVLIVPGLAWLAWPARHLLRGRTLALAVSALGTGLLPYLYPLIRAQDNPGLNWDDPRNLGALWHLFRRADYGSLSLLPESVRGLFQEASPLDQLPVYLQTMLGGSHLVVAGLILAGAWWLARRDHRALGALLGVWFVSGPAFLMYARYPLEDPFWVGVVQRFYLLPHVALSILAGCSVAWAGRRRALPVGLALTALVAGLGFAHLPEVDHSQDTVARDYVENLLQGVPQDALLLTSGDAPGMLLEYVRYVEGRRTDLVILDQDKLAYPWYVDSKRREHPSVVFPWKRLDGETALLADLVAANYGTRPILLWDFIDPSLTGRFRLLPAGLTQRVADPGEDPDPARIADQIVALWESYNRRTLQRSWPPRSFNHLLTSFYGFPFYSVGFEFERRGRLDEAAGFYRRAIEAAGNYAPPYRRLGLLLAGQGHTAEARRSLEGYLQVEPRARDRDQIRRVLQELGGGISRPRPSASRPG